MVNPKQLKVQFLSLWKRWLNKSEAGLFTVDSLMFPTGIITLLFTDIEASTRLVQLLGERYQDLLAEHHAILRQAIGAWDGLVVDTQGDAFFAVFAHAQDALAAAIASQRALAQHSWPAGLHVRVRMGLHTGEPAMTNDGYYVGLDIHRAARVCTAGSPHPSHLQPGTGRFAIWHQFA